MNVWFTSDAHIGHGVVAHDRQNKWRGDHHLPFDKHVEKDPAVIAWHNDLLAENWDSMVKKDDLVIDLGDISSGGSQAQRNALEWKSKRPGRKKLIIGNHDGPFGQNTDAHKWFKPYGEVYESIASFARYKASGHKVMLSHFPYSGDHKEPDRYQQYRLRPIDLPVIHGHTHSIEKLSRSTQSMGSLLQIHVGVDAWGYRPVNLDEIIPFLEAEKQRGLDILNGDMPAPWI